MDCRVATLLAVTIFKDRLQNLVQRSRKFLAVGLQTAAGVPLQCDEPADFMTFRVGLFGLEKWHNVDRTVAQLAAALDKVL